MIYDPAEDSFLICEVLNNNCGGKVVLDMGAGSGIVGEFALSRGAKYVLFADIDEEVVSFLRNKDLNVIHSNLFENVSSSFDLVVFNPPYLPRDLREDIESAKVTCGGTEGDEIILNFLESVGDYLKPQGEVILLISSLTPRDKILRKIEIKGFSFKVLRKKKIFMEELEVWGLRKI